MADYATIYHFIAILISSLYQSKLNIKTDPLEPHQAIAPVPLIFKILEKLEQ